MGVRHERETSLPHAVRRDARAESTGSRSCGWRFVVSVFAALAAVALAGHVSESVIVLGVIVLATMASWFQMERPVLEHALTRTHRR